MKNSELDHTLAVLAQKLGTTVDHLWSVLVHQARIQGMIDVSYMFVGASVVLAYFLFIFPNAKKYFDEDNEPMGAFFIATSIASLFAIIGILMNIGCTITEFVNPEYWALQQLGRWF